MFADGREHGERSSATFDNAITPVGPVDADDLRRDGPRRLLFYARPEVHASRNLFEVGMMALDAAIASGGFSGWELAGVGTVELGGGALELPRSGATLRLIPRGPQADYGRMLSSFDAGLALMYTPDPGLVALEMAAAGMPNGHEHVREQGRRRARADFIQPDRVRSNGRGRHGRSPAWPRRAPGTSVASPWLSGRLAGELGRGPG